MASSSKNKAIFRVEFERNLRALIGAHPARSIIGELSRAVAGGGEEFWLPSVDAKASDAAVRKVFYDDKTMKAYYESGGTEDFANWMLTRTPHNAVHKLSNLSEAQLIDWGHSWNPTEDGDWLTIVNPKSQDMQTCARKVHEQIDLAFGVAVCQHEVQRKIRGSAVAGVQLPASQKVATMTYAQVTVDSMAAAIREIMGENYIGSSMPVYCAISPAVARALKASSSELVRSRDFIKNYASYEKGDLPDIEGVHFVEVPKSLMDQIRADSSTTFDGASVDHFFAWTPEAIAKVNYEPLTIQMANDPGAKFHEVAYVSQLIDYVRTDDLGVVRGEITA